MCGRVACFLFAVGTYVVFLTSASQPPSKKWSDTLVEDWWSPAKLRQIAMDKKMAAVVSSLTKDAQTPVTPAIQREMNESSAIFSVH